MFKRLALLSVGWLLSMGIRPADAHELKANSQVGALMHIQPDDSPQAGKAVVTWFGLVKRGGESVPLAKCDCHLAIYSGKQAKGTALIIPILREGKIEEPVGTNTRLVADVTFPKAGEYTMVLSGKPKAGGH
ncbi:MAG: hypothetical protein H7Y37_16035, partial [Anaerolineae bacterium]|nr:hypothetical protein [Gloeobacterales cyanobacterium ES-bin-313]